VPEGSISFDRAARYYDRTRRVSPQLLRAMVDLLRAEAPPRGLALEVGTGTGTLSLPLHRKGSRVVGLDLSLEMLRQVRAKGEPGPPLVGGDAMLLPFRDGTFDLVFARHVLHLVGEWRTAAGEMARVAARGGRILVTGGCYAGAYDELIEVFTREAGRARPLPGLLPSEEPLLDEWMRSLGARVRVLDLGSEPPDETLREFLAAIDANLFSWTWPLGERDRERAAAATRRWAEERYGDLDRPIPAQLRVIWRAYDLP